MHQVLEVHLPHYTWFHLSNILKTGLLLVIKYFYRVVFLVSFCERFFEFLVNEETIILYNLHIVKTLLLTLVCSCCKDNISKRS